MQQGSLAACAASETATKRKRIDQMLEELRAGGVYMRMAHRPSKRAR